VKSEQLAVQSLAFLRQAALAPDQGGGDLLGGVLRKNVAP